LDDEQQDVAADETMVEGCFVIVNESCCMLVQSISSNFSQHYHQCFFGFGFASALSGDNTEENKCPPSVQQLVSGFGGKTLTLGDNSSASL
jgi:hypothetical protein